MSESTTEAVRWNWVRLDLEPGQERSSHGPGYDDKPAAAAPMRSRVEALIDRHPLMRPVAQRWLAGSEDGDTLIFGRAVFALYSYDGSAANRDLEAKNWISDYLGWDHGTSR